MSEEEIQVIYKFLELYKNERFIVADRIVKKIDTVSLEEKSVVIKCNGDNWDNWKTVSFWRTIHHNRKRYDVALVLLGEFRGKDEPESWVIKTPCL